MTDTPQTTTPETASGKLLREMADKIDALMLRERVCDAQCGPMQNVAESWYRAEREFDLPDDGPYEAIVRLRTEIEFHESREARFYLTEKLA